MHRKSACITVGELISTLILLVYVLICYFYKSEIPALLNWCGIVIFMYAIYTWKLKTNSSWFSPYTILFLFFMLFNYGEPIMWAFNIHLPTELGTGELYYQSGFYPTQTDVMNAQWYTCMGMLLFHFGALLFVKRNMRTMEIQDETDSVADYSKVKSSMRTVGGMLICIISPIAIYTKIQEVIIARSYGYKALYYGEFSTQSGYVQILMYLFFPALICFLIGSDYSKKARAIVFSVFGLYATLGILSGDRGSWLYSLVILIWLHTHYVKTSMKKYIWYGVLGIVGIYLLSVVTASRNAGLSFSADDFIAVFSAEESPIVSAFFEMGGTMGIITYFLHCGNGIYPYGNSYITAIFGVVSSRFLRLLGLNQVLIGNWFSQDHLGLEYGTGFSMLGEAYVNGGYTGGLIYMFIWGAVIGKLIQFASKNSANESPLKLFITTAGLNTVVGFARGDCYLIVKQLFYGVALVAFLIYFMSKKLGNKHEKK